MISKRRQRGMSIWMLIYILGSLGAFGLVGLKLFPIYLESFKIDKALEAVAAESAGAKRSKNEIRDALLKRLDIDEVRRISKRNFNDYVTISAKANSIKIDLAYRAETTLAGNVLLVADFKKSVAK